MTGAKIVVVYLRSLHLLGADSEGPDEITNGVSKGVMIIKSRQSPSPTNERLPPSPPVHGQPSHPSPLQFYWR